MDVKTPFAMDGGDRIEDTPVHKALREALANCLINADYYGTRGVVIKKEPQKLILENPGYIRTGKVQMRKGGESDPRNKSLMKMFNLINIGERAGSGVPNIFNTWNDEGWKEPVIEERFDPDRTVLTLEFVKKQAEKTSEKSKRRKTSDHIERIYEYLTQHGESKTNDIADYIDLSPSRTRVILSEMENIEIIGTNTNRKYRLKQ
jgi:predicted HTH transcriptional regulator